jgi:stage II sporulation protein M
MLKKNKGWLGLFFTGQLEYIEKIIPLIAITTIVFFFSIFAGYALGDQTSPQSFEGVLSNIPDPTEASSIEMFTAILYNNVVASFLFVLSGFLVGIPPLIFMAFNGFFIGYISWNVAQTQGLLFVIATILRHGIIEIPSILLSAAMGMGLGFKIIHRLMRREGLQKYVSETFSVFVKRIVPLLVFAAGIETALIYMFVL